MFNGQKYRGFKEGFTQLFNNRNWENVGKLDVHLKPLYHDYPGRCCQVGGVLQEG